VKCDYFEALHIELHVHTSNLNTDFNPLHLQRKQLQRFAATCMFMKATLKPTVNCLSGTLPSLLVCGFLLIPSTSWSHNFPIKYTPPFGQSTWRGLTYTLNSVTGRSFHCQVEHHVRTKFVALILYVIDNFNNCDVFFHIYIIINNIFEYFFELCSHFHSCSNSFSSVLRHSSWKWYVLFNLYFIKKHQVWLPIFTM